jgi:histidinol-phosphate phosphatase family protein
MTGEVAPATPEGRARRVSLVQSDGVGQVLREMRAALFLDRDGTLIEDVGYIKDPNDVALVPGVAGALRTAHNRQWPVIVVTNQSGIARGKLTAADYDAVRKRTLEMLSEFGAYIDAEYVCPHHPDFTGPCDCRKPGVALFERAMNDHGIDGGRSAFIGDRWRDIAPAAHFGGRGILVPSPGTPTDEVEKARAEMTVVATLQEAVDLALSRG